MTKTLLLVLASGLATACVYTPRMTTRYDEACDIEVRHLVLSAQPTGLGYQFGQCTNEQCLATLLAIDVLLVPVTAIVSGSVVLVGNTVFWMQKQGRCKDGSRDTATLGPVLASRA